MSLAFNNTLLATAISKPEVSKQAKEIFARLEEFRGLEYNWDSYQAKAVKNDVIDFSKKVALRLLEIGIHIDFCVPMRDGGIQFEFIRLGNECELEIKPSPIHILQFEFPVNDEPDILSSLKDTMVYLRYNDTYDIVEEKELSFKELELKNF